MKSSLSPAELEQLIARTDGYSASDLTAVCKEAVRSQDLPRRFTVIEPMVRCPFPRCLTQAMGPVREVTAAGTLASLPVDRMPPVTAAHFAAALRNVRPSVSAERLALCGSSFCSRSRAPRASAQSPQL